MRMTAQQIISQKTEELDLVSLDRLSGEPDPRDLADSDPFPSGGLAQLVRSSFDFDDRNELLARFEGLCSVAGGLPNHLYDAMIATTHEGEQSLLEFIRCLDAPFQRIEVRQSRQFPLVRIHDSNHRDNNRDALVGVSQSISRRIDDLFVLGNYLTLKSNRRNIGELQLLIKRISGYPTQIHVKTGIRQPIPRHRQNVLSAANAAASPVKRQGTLGLGRGMAIGRSGHPNLSQIMVILQLHSRDELLVCRKDPDFAPVVRRLALLYLREPADIQIRAKIPRSALSPLRIYSRRIGAARRGPYQIVQPEARPNDFAVVSIEQTSRQIS